VDPRPTVVVAPPEKGSAEQRRSVLRAEALAALRQRRATAKIGEQLV
jgi:hypothetical protein